MTGRRRGMKIMENRVLKDDHVDWYLKVELVPRAVLIVCEDFLRI